MSRLAPGSRYAGLRPYEVFPGQPGGRAPAPGRLAIVQAFVNTLDAEHGIEGFATPDQLRAFLLDYGLLEPQGGVDEWERRTAVGVREAVRSQLLVHSGELAAAEGVEL